MFYILKNEKIGEVVKRTNKQIIFLVRINAYETNKELGLLLA